MIEMHEYKVSLRVTNKSTRLKNRVVTNGVIGVYQQTYLLFFFYLNKAVSHWYPYISSLFFAIPFVLTSCSLFGSSGAFVMSLERLVVSQSMDRFIPNVINEHSTSNL